jgi:hypothetical protein
LEGTRRIKELIASFVSDGLSTGMGYVFFNSSLVVFETIVDFSNLRLNKEESVQCYTLRALSRNRRMIMAANLEDELIDKVRALPPDKQQEALRLLDTLASVASSEPNGTGMERRPIWEVVDEINASLPADTWENVPTDGSINLDHHLYGAPKQQP